MSYSTYQTIVYSWMAIGLATFILLLKITAPYGRHTTTKWGPQISNHLGWMIMEVPVMIVLMFFILTNLENQNAVTWFLISAFMFHYINRTFIFPFRIRTTGKKMPVVIVASAVFFNLVNGFSLGYYFAHFANYDYSWFQSITFISGLILFVAGVLINWKSDNILISLRKPNETGYVIPKGWLFNYISCPNLFGEIVEWFGFVLMCWNLPAVSFFAWTCANLIPRAISHHKWYKEKFTDYPQNRKAVIPFLI
jgi:3-oxo-5-alpha-steroid 4-dehydrogenase 1